ncbi:MAG: pyridoxamine 5'-phosphate oxidase family protein [Anaerovoracaceae bacterium]
MFRTMRSEKNATSYKEAEAMLREATHGVLSVHGDEDYPYGVPISFAYEDGKIYFHGTSDGSHRINSIKKNPRVSFCVVTQDNILPEKFNTLYRSAIAFGTARVLTNPEEKAKAMDVILRKYSKDYLESGRKYAENDDARFCAVELTIEHLTGKAGN